MKPLFKYTGGKYKEYKNIKDLLPSEINNYYEPFVGGGGIYFKLNEEGKIHGKNYINDLSRSLIEFYYCVGKHKFMDELCKLSNAWNSIRSFSKDFAERYGVRYFEIIQGRLNEEFVYSSMEQYIMKYCCLFSYDTHDFDLFNKIIEQLKNKTMRFMKKNIGEDEPYVAFKSLTTAICQAFYFIIRDMYNDWNVGGNELDYTMEERCAHWYFIREYCFGSMFRCGKDGKFNVPYGGFVYNDKCFDCKIEKVFSDEAKFISENTETSCLDFEDVINLWNFKENDFMFLDPPYDSTFSEYDGIEFSRKDHERLANVLKSVKCKWMMVIGKTDFISELYKNFNITEYNKTYMYQARGEYDNKHTTHLIVTNY